MKDWLGNLFMGKFIHLEKKKVENEQCDVKFRNLSRFLKRSSEILADEKTFLKKSHAENCNFSKYF